MRLRGIVNERRSLILCISFVAVLGAAHDAENKMNGKEACGANKKNEHIRDAELAAENIRWDKITVTRLLDYVRKRCASPMLENGGTTFDNEDPSITSLYVFTFSMQCLYVLTPSMRCLYILTLFIQGLNVLSSSIRFLYV